MEGREPTYGLQRGEVIDALVHVRARMRLALDHYEEGVREAFKVLGRARHPELDGHRIGWLLEAVKDKAIRALQRPTDFEGEDREEELRDWRGRDPTPQEPEVAFNGTVKWLFKRQEEALLTLKAGVEAVVRVVLLAEELPMFEFLCSAETDARLDSLTTDLHRISQERLAILQACFDERKLRYAEGVKDGA